MASGPAPLSTVVFRYFNAAGAAPQFGLGEVHDPETHLIPKALSATLAPPSRRMAQALTINGADYPTADGTCVRDYVHVLDLAEAHLLGLRYLLAGGSSDVFNLGSGSGATIREIVAAIERTTGAAVPYRIGPRRAGDSPRLVANIGKAGRVLGWRPRYQLEDIISSAAQFHGAQQLSG
jgi:UDP-glucose 4-epimerase